MANVIVEEQSLIDVANAIRTQNGTDNSYKPSEMAGAILDITTSEDLTNEFDNYETYLSNQETTIDDIVSALNGKIAASAMKGMQCIDAGSFMLDKDVSTTYYIPHELGQAPNFYILFAEDEVSDPANHIGYIRSIIHIVDPYYNNIPTIRYGSNIIMYGASTGKIYSTSNSYLVETKCTDTQLWIDAASSRKLKAGIKYRWVAGVIDGM